MKQKHIDEKYRFMLEKGYEIISTEGVPAGWQTVLRKSDLVVKIYRARGEDDVSFRTSAQPPDEFYDIGSVVYAATGEIIPLSAYDDLSRYLQKYLGRIETYYQDDPVKMQDSLKVAQKEYHAAINPVVVAPEVAALQVVAPKEPRKIPILYYPLLGIILLLILGALTTLYAVLLERLFSAFSLDPDSYGLFMTSGAVLLAIGTMFLFRGRRQKS